MRDQKIKLRDLHSSHAMGCEYQFYMGCLSCPNEFELWLDNFTPFYIPAEERSKIKKNEQPKFGFFFSTCLKVWVQNGKSSRPFETLNKHNMEGGQVDRRPYGCFARRLQSLLRYFRNRRTGCTLTVSCRRRGKLGCRSNSLSFCVAHVTSHVSS